MDKYTQIVPLSFDIDSSAEKEAERKINKFVSSFKSSLGDLGFDNIAKELEDALKNNSMLSELDGMLKELDGLHGEQIDSLREQLEYYRKQLDPVKDINDLLEEQFEIQQQISSLSENASEDDIQSLNEMSTQIEQQIALLGTDGQLGILKKKRDLEKEILALSVLNTNEAKNQISNLQEQLEWLNKVYDIEYEEVPEEVDNTSTQKEDIMSSLKDFKDSGLLGNFGKQFNNFKSILTGFKTGFIGGLLATGAVFIKSLKDTLEEGAEQAESLLQADRYSDSGTRETMWEWGTTKAGAYGVNQAMSIMGFKSQEDVWNSSDTEQKRFYDLQNRYAEKFIKLQESGLFENMLENQIEMKELEYDLQMKEAEYYMENEDSIKAIKEMTMDIKLFFVDLLGGIADIFNWFKGNKSTYANTNKTTDILESKTTNNNNSRTTQVTIDRSFNNQSASDKSSVETALSNFFNIVDANIS